MKQTMIGIAFFFGGISMFIAEVVSQYGNGCLAMPGICLGVIGLVILFYELHCVYRSRIRAAFQDRNSFGEESDDSEK